MVCNWFFRAECTVCAVRWQRTRLEWTYRCTTVEIFVALGGGAADVGEHQAAARRTPPGKSIAIRCRGGSRRERAEVTVVDASAVIEMLLGTPLGRLCAKRLLEPTEPLCVPQLIYVETAQALRRYALAGELDPGRGSEALEDLHDLPLTPFPHEPFLPRIWSLRDTLTAYDAIYVALAEALEARVVTCDARLGRAHGHRARVEVLTMAS